MTEQDCQTILWIAKRLVFKYKEDPKIISSIESIIKKEQDQLLKYQQICDANNKNIETIIDGLYKIKSYNKIKDTISINTSYNKIQSISSVNSIFENFDMSQLEY